MMIEYSSTNQHRKSFKWNSSRFSSSSNRPGIYKLFISLILCSLLFYLFAFTSTIQGWDYRPLRTINKITMNKISIEIMIPSFCSDEERQARDEIRGSWLKYRQWIDVKTRCNISHNFYIGKTKKCDQDLLNQEIMKNKDIVRLNITESWEGLQRKTMHMISVAFSNNIGGNTFDLLLKTDTDVYVNLPELCTKMTNLMVMNNWNGEHDALYIGKQMHQTPILNHGKYGNEEWARHINQPTYLSYMIGGFYLLTHKTAEIVYNSYWKNRDHIAFNPMEDAYLGHFLSSFDITLVDTYTTPRSADGNLTFNHVCPDGIDWHCDNFNYDIIAYHVSFQNQMVSKYEQHLSDMINKADKQGYK